MKRQGITISVIVTCYNEGDLLNNAVQSLRQQTDRDFEIIIINDGSRDIKTNIICEGLEKESDVRVIWLKRNSGLSIARNKGFKEMNGEVAVLLDGDDLLPKSAIDKIRTGFNNIKDAEILFGNYRKTNRVTGESVLVDCSVFAGSNNRLVPNKIRPEWKLMGTSPMKKKTWEEIGGYDPKLTYGGLDVDFWLRALRSNCKCYYIHSNIYEWRVSDSGMHLSKNRQFSGEIIFNKNIDFIKNYCEPDTAIKILASNGLFANLKKYAFHYFKNGGKLNFQLIIILFIPVFVFKALKKMYSHIKK